MRINGFNNIPSSNMQQGAHRMNTNVTQQPKSAKVAHTRDTVEISSQKQPRIIDAQNETAFSLLPWMEQHWNKVREKAISFLLKRGILKIDEVDPERIQFNPYFMVEMKRDWQNWAFFQKVKYRVHAVSQSLVKWFSEFTGSSYFAKKEESKEELPKKDRYRKTALKKEDKSKEESIEYHIDRRV